MEIVYNLVVLGISNLGEAMLPKTSGAMTNLGVGKHPMHGCFNVVYCHFQHSIEENEGMLISEN
jgi:hypothetical protein